MNFRARRVPLRISTVMVGVVAFAVWLLLGVQAAYWGWHAWGNSTAMSATPLPATPLPRVSAEFLARALGAKDPKVPEPRVDSVQHPLQADNVGGWRLLGVVAGPDGAGAAVLAREGAHARPYRVGAELPGGWRVDRVEPHAVWLHPLHGGDALRLALTRPAVP